MIIITTISLIRALPAECRKWIRVELSYWLTLMTANSQCCLGSLTEINIDLQHPRCWIYLTVA